MTLKAIDIASWQAGIVPSATDADIVIVKATGGTSYKNPYWKQWADDVLASGKLLALYHFANDISWGSAKDEARFFLEATRAYRGRFVPILDWESMALNNPPSWAAEWLETVERETGSTPMFYGYASNIAWTDYSALAKWPLWMASYLNKYQGAGWVDNPDNPWGYGSWREMKMYQYTSTGRISGYGSRLDLSVFYGTRDDWIAMQGGGKMVRANEVAVQYMKHLCTCPEHGYSQPGRYGTGGYCDVQTDAGVKKARKGDRDCSSSTSEAWAVALEGTPWEGMLSNRLATYTMKDAFLATGLFEWKPMSFMAQPGDLYLKEGKSGGGHVAMCVQNDSFGDLLAEFIISENHTIDGEPGDQTGWESRIVDYWDFGWDGILHYNGKADIEEDDFMAMTDEQMRKFARMIAEEQASYAYGSDKDTIYDAYGKDVKKGGIAIRNNYNALRMIIAGINDIRKKLDQLIAK